MKRLLISLLATLALSATHTYAAAECDEKCKRDAFKAKTDITFPAYLTWEYCTDLREEFMTSTMNSVGSYINNKFDLRFKGGIRNTMNFLAERKSWVMECNAYMQSTDKDALFVTNEKTDEILKLTDSVIKEFNGILEGKKYSTPDDTVKAIKSKYEALFATVDDHRNLMHMRGRYVYK